MQEPSVLDYLKQMIVSDDLPAHGFFRALPWRAFSGLGLALLAQHTLDTNPGRVFGETAIIGVVLYILAGLMTAWAVWINEWGPAIPPRAEFRKDNLRVRPVALIAGLALALGAFLTSTNNRFTWLNFGLLLLALASLVFAFWQPGPSPGPNRRALSRVDQLAWALLVLTILTIAAWFRFARLDQVPGEMNSDHAEKIMDIIRLLSGQAHIFFPNNGGREALQFYLAAGAVKFGGASLSFMTLKSISALAGFLALPFFYLLGKEIGNRRVGLLALAFAGVAYWPNVVSRLGLRLPFYILFTAMALFFLLRGLRLNRRNDFIWLGLTLGLSLYGYSADRILPLVILVGVVLYLLHNRQPGEREQIFWFSLMAFILAGVVFLPMFHYILEDPGAFFYRTITRLSGLEQPLATPAWLTFLRNTGRALGMVSWSNGEVWTASVPYRPALEIVSGALFWTGAAGGFVAYMRNRNWLHLFLLCSVPLLMLPSILALAFPNENPNLYRTGGASIPVFLLAALALEGIMAGLEKATRALSNHRERNNLAKIGVISAWALAAILFFFSARQSFDLVFSRYRQEYALAAWNSSEMGELARSFAGTYGQVNNVWVMGYPYWVDTRLVGITSGYPLHNFALFAKDIRSLPDNHAAKLFIVNPQDWQALDALSERFSQGVLSTYPSKTPGKEFLLFYVPPLEG
jgi:hypothetical protein